ncbi:carbohydrate ABC transporter permease [Jeotgalibacillus proteolyticus]|uniref:Sugar ABC transporter permease n=1 Tax=Jeotgalibacillus proteolyticus TaxID=2082395 RepID=A0A2S5G9M5_9BACL|nr:sugar ABC transporter permease [Jeotgalibacillus proteolyticus]PPA69621.1 sugar ABC transporter permease [Jeotgalibacillus proteolyticus]
MYHSKSTKYKALLFIAPFLACFLIFWLAPVLYGIWISLNDYKLSMGNLGFVGLENYKTIFDTGSVYHTQFMNALKNTFVFMAISVPPLVLISLGLALLIDNLPSKLKVFFRTIFFLSYAISVTAVSAIFLWLFNANGGFVNNLLMTMNITNSPVNWLTEQPYAWFVVLISTVWWTIGFNMLLFVNALDEVDGALYEAADLDGANSFKKFLYVTLPEIRNVAFFVIITTVIASFNLYGQTMLITNGGPARSTTSLIMNINHTVFSGNQLGIGSAMAIVMGVIMTVVTGLQYWANLKINSDGPKRKRKGRSKKSEDPALVNAPLPYQVDGKETMKK